MHVIDSDAHVEESVETWKYLDAEFYPWRPIPVVFPEDTCFGSHNAGWIVDYKLRCFAANPTIMKRAGEKEVAIPVQEMNDVPARVKWLDELGIDKQVVFPSAWLGCLAENVELEAALARSYNTFMATQCGRSGGRLAYVAVLPYRRPDLAIPEVRLVKEMGGAAGIFARGFEGEMPLSHPALFPIYEEIERQDLPLTVHVGNGTSPTISRMFEGMPRPVSNTVPNVHPLGAGIVSGPYVIYAFQQILSSSVLEEFPRLRVAFLEAGCEWAVRLVKDLCHKKGAKIGKWLGERVFVSCRLDDDLPYVMSKLGEDFLITATDFPHGDAFRQDQLREGLMRRGDVSDATADKVLSTNPARLFHF